MSQAESIGSLRVVMRRLRDLMREAGTPEHKLASTVRLIAAEMVAEVCSIYLLRPGEILELMATQGLRPEAVRRTRLRVGEGIVGEIADSAMPLALEDAPSHPSFAYRPETGEEAYRSMCGVPILRAGRVIGVLAVQNRTPRAYAEEEIESLETVAMVLAELISGSGLTRGADGGGLSRSIPEPVHGVRLSSGLAVGRAMPHRRRVIVRRVVAEDPVFETKRLHEALAAMQARLESLFSAPDLRLAGAEQDILETYRMFAADRGWLRRIEEAIRSGLTAEAAVQRVVDETRTRMRQIDDPYLSERLHDLEDLNDRLIQHLVGETTRPEAEATESDNRNLVVFARSMGPADLLEYDRNRLAGLVLSEGSPTSHVSILARALGIPAVSHAGSVVLEAEEGDTILVDGDLGLVILRPEEDVLEAAEDRLAQSARLAASLADLKGRKAASSDGQPVILLANAGMPFDVDHMVEAGGDGIGLFRTEIAFMAKGRLPSVAEQVDLYRAVLDHAAELPVVFRTLDIGADKKLPYFSFDPDENPAMGWRSIRIGLDRPALLRQQLRAMLASADGVPLKVMFPMITSLAEFRAARDILEAEVARHPSAARPEVGAMLEVPALLWELDELLAEVDFLSVGSNDLVQFLCAADRSSPNLADRYDVLTTPVLRALRQIATASRSSGKPVTVCGEMAGEPIAALALLGLGFRRLSMSPRNIARIKRMILSLDLHSVENYLMSLLSRESTDLRRQLRSFAQDRDIAI